MNIRYFLPIAAAALMVITAAADNNDQYTRMDFFSPEGNRIFSEYTEPSNFVYSQFYNNTWTPGDGRYYMNELGRIDFIQPGSVTNGIDFTAAEDVKVSVMQSSTRESRVPAKVVANHIDGEFGTVYTFRIEVPDGKVPHCEVEYPYTCPDMGSVHYVQSKFYPLAWDKNYNYQSTNMESRRWMNADIVTFQKDETEPNIWYFEWEMNNEPINMTFSARLEAEPEYLRKAMQNILYSLYEQKNAYISNEGFGSNHSPSGEASIMDIYGNCHSDDYISNLIVAEDVDHNISGLTGLMNGRTYFACYGWEYCYATITYANRILDNLEPFKATMAAEELDVIKAQLLTLRANAYFNLMRVYGPRWEDSNNGAVLCAPLEITFNTEYQAPASMKDIADRCYMDLDEAIGIFKSRNYKRKYIVEPDINVARGIKMRVAMLRHDWNSAKTLSADILKDKPLSTSDEILGGFIDHADSWIWGAQENRAGNPDKFGADLYHWAFGEHYNSNGSYAAHWSLGAAAIDKDLYNSIPATDIRRKQFAMRTDLFPKALNSQIPSDQQWYVSSNVNTEKLFYCQNNDWTDFSKKMAKAFSVVKPAGVTFPPFQAIDAFYSPVAEYVPFTYGANLKFLTRHHASLSDGCDVCFMRAEEALLDQAEACYRLGDEATARKLLTDLNSTRDSEYACTATGEALFDEIRKYRRIELWGEGHSWFDAKRWNLPLKRNIYDITDVNSGNWPSSYQPEVATDASNGWRYPVPRYYVNQNNLIDVEKMGYKGVTGYEASESAPEKTPALREESDQTNPTVNSIRRQTERINEMKSNAPSKEMQPIFIAR